MFLSTLTKADVKIKKQMKQKHNLENRTSHSFICSQLESYFPSMGVTTQLVEGKGKQHTNNPMEKDCS